MKSRVVAAVPLPPRSAVRTPAASACDIARSSVSRGGALAEPLAEHQRGGEQHAARVRDALAGDLGRRAVGRPEDARARLRQAAGGDDARAVSLAAARSETSSACAGWVTTTQKRVGLVHQPRERLARGYRRSTSTPGCCSASQSTNVLQPAPSPTAVTRRAAGAGEAEGARGRRTARAGRRAALTIAMSPSGQPDALDAPGQVELGLDALERGLLRQRDEHGVGRRGRPRASRPAAGGRGG